MPRAARGGPLTPERLASMHPRLHHFAQAGAHEGVRRHGLLSAAAAVALWGADPSVLAAPRPRAVRLDHPEHGVLWLNDNRPLRAGPLARCLEGGLTPDDWLASLNARVFLWAREEDGLGFARARLAQGHPTELMVFDALGLARAHWGRIEVAPINTGSALRRPAPRGPGTFAPAEGLDWAAWRRRRGLSAPDRIKEVTVLGAVPDAGDHLMEVRRVG